MSQGGNTPDKHDPDVPVTPEIPLDEAQEKLAVPQEGLKQYDIEDMIARFKWARSLYNDWAPRFRDIIGDHNEDDIGEFAFPEIARYLEQEAAAHLRFLDEIDQSLARDREKFQAEVEQARKEIQDDK